MSIWQGLRSINRFARNVFAHESLDEAVPYARAKSGRHFAALLLSAEPLASDPEPELTSRPPGFLGRLLASEMLPEDPPAPRPPSRPGLLSALFVPEQLPELPVQPARPQRSAWLRWLFGFERLDPP